MMLPLLKWLNHCFLAGNCFFMSFLELLADIYADDDLVIQTAGASWTLADLKARVLYWRAHMALPAGYVVALYADNCFDWIAVDIACMEAGLVNVPLPIFFSDEQIQDVLNRTSPALLLSDNPDRTDQLWAVSASQVKGSKLSMARADLPLKLECPRGTAKISFTSGSTGSPKGVCLSGAQQLQQARRLIDRVAIEKVLHLNMLPYSILLENIGGIYAPLLAGGVVHVAPLASQGMQSSTEINLPAMLEAITRVSPTTMILIPQLLQLLTYAAASGWTSPASLRFIAVGGAHVPPGLITRARWLGISAYKGYGLTECCSVVSLNAAGDEKPGTIGRPLDGIRVSVVDGEFVVEGSVMLGYLDDPGSWYKQSVSTGDLGEIGSEGFMVIKGRAKNVIITSMGRNISPEWLEAMLVENPAINDVMVYGDSMPYCVALIDIRNDKMDSQDIDAWIHNVNAKLPAYAHIHRWYRLEKPLSQYSGLLTVNGRKRRHEISDYFRNEIDSLYKADKRSG